MSVRTSPAERPIAFMPRYSVNRLRRVGVAMKKKRALFTSRMLPVAKTLPQGKAASIGRTLMRYAYLEWRLAYIVYRLLGISIKQGRVAVKLPQSRACINIIEDLLAFLGVITNFNFRQLGKKLEAAERARNVLAHSVYQVDGKTILVQVVRGSWELDQEFEPVKRVLQPESKVLDVAFLSMQRRLVEHAIMATEELAEFVEKTLAELNDKRRTEPHWDRRKASKT